MARSGYSAYAIYPVEIRGAKLLILYLPDNPETKRINISPLCNTLIIWIINTYISRRKHNNRTFIPNIQT